MRSRGAATANEARKPGIPSGRFTASTTTSPAKSAAQSLPATGARSEEQPQHQEGHTRCTRSTSSVTLLMSICAPGFAISSHPTVP